MIMYSVYCHVTVEPVYNGHCISRSPLYNSQVAKFKRSLWHVFQPVLAGHLSIAATFGGPQGDHYRQVLLCSIYCTRTNGSLLIN